MYSKPENYSEIVTIRGVNIYMPQFGYGVDADRELIVKPVEIIKRSENELEQYWERQEPPEEFNDWVEDEKSKKQIDETYFNYELEKFRQREWHRRLFGVWVYIKGKQVYLPGSYYFFLNYWMLDSGFPVFRKSDWKKAIYWKWNEYNPKSYGMIEVTKRRGGKSVFAGCMLTEYATRTEKAICNMQSKTDDDAKKLFDYHIVTPFQSLSPIFTPLYDTNKGTKPEQKLSFYAASARGKNATIVNEQLKSDIAYENSKPLALDGQKLARLILDERGKVDFDLIEAHLIIRKCLLDWRMNIVGKMIVTTTVEEIGLRSKFFELWQQSNPAEEVNGTTKSGLYSFFMPADEAGDCDIYGDAFIEKNRSQIEENRANLEGNSKGLIAEMRKDPLSEREAFMILNNNCHFDPMLLNELFQNAKIGEKEVVEYGNYYWKDGIPFTESLWMPCDKSTARWHRAKNFIIPDVSKYEMYGDSFMPTNHIQFISATDPFQNDITEETINSKASGGVLNRYEDGTNNDIFNRMFVCKYHARPLMAKLYHMDMALQCFAYGCQLLVEAKMEGGIRKFFIDNNLGAFLIYLPGKENAGIDPNQDNKTLLVNLWEEYINTAGKEGKLIYPDVIDDDKDGLLKFDVNNTEVSNQVMGLGWTLVADFFKKANFRKKLNYTISDYFPKRAI